jgi:hypothetical protein
VRLEVCGGTAEEGVVGCVEPVSEGGWEVVGVSGSDGAAFEDSDGCSSS